MHIENQDLPGGEGSLMVRSIVNINQRDLGVDSSNILLGRVGLFEEKYPSEAWRAQFFEALTEDLAEMPGVTHAFASGVSIIQVTHNKENAARGQRTVDLLDGRFRSDATVANS